MNAKDFKAKAKKLGATVKKVDSAYWGKIWYETTIRIPTGSIEFQFEENKPLDRVSILSGNYGIVTPEDMEKSAEMYKAIAEFVREINAL